MSLWSYFFGENSDSDDIDSTDDELIEDKFIGYKPIEYNSDEPIDYNLVSNIINQDYLWYKFMLDNNKKKYIDDTSSLTTQVPVLDNLIDIDDVKYVENTPNTNYCYSISAEELFYRMNNHLICKKANLKGVIGNNSQGERKFNLAFT